MTRQRYQVVRELFHLAIERQVSQRAAFLDQACPADPELRAEVERLLACDQQESPFMETPAFVAENAMPCRDAALVPGRRVGPYQIVHEIGFGGMGTVYLAERADGAYQKQVAIKLVKRGLDTDDVLRRFHNERQILANLDHANIAKLLDGGTTDDGLSYFVMDYVEGCPIDVYCDDHTLPTIERLKIFCTICSAVSYAHRHHVVHRDLKPSNILVTPEGVPKLLDFGIAKVLHRQIVSGQTEGLPATQGPMTLYYASPEQVRGETITTASDVYSLGVLLYQLLTGHWPYHLRSDTPQEIERVICEEHPERPSAAIDRVEEVPGNEGMSPLTLTPASVSETRDGQPYRLRQRLVGDLDNIVLMALRKEPARRYACVDQFSDDLRRYLEGKPVRGRPDTLIYRSGKFIKRNPTSVMVSAVMAIGLLVTIGLGRFLPGSRQSSFENPIESLAVLPLTNLSHDTEQDYFVDGMTDALITDLAQIRQLRVISRTSVMRYKATNTSLPEIGRTLNVDVVVEGSVLRSGDRVRITAQLIEVKTDRHLWANTYNRDLVDILTLQSEVAQAIAHEIKVKLTPQDQLHLATKRPVDSEAREAYLKGLYHQDKATEDGLKKAVEFFQRAVDRDPSYANAYARIGQRLCCAEHLWRCSADAMLSQSQGRRPQGSGAG
jgi:serine/threonine protein kinase